MRLGFWRLEAVRQAKMVDYFLRRMSPTPVPQLSISFEFLANRLEPLFRSSIMTGETRQTVQLSVHPERMPLSNYLLDIEVRKVLQGLSAGSRGGVGVCLALCRSLQCSESGFSLDPKSTGFTQAIRRQSLLELRLASEFAERLGDNGAVDVSIATPIKPRKSFNLLHATLYHNLY
jgi:hypothetical protein